uniref:WGS project CAEQ00000000 data, annotated contig 1705 n=1 Tax=Trypanosoma congolense (strain IL3000) TaxID=1068625 RepID=F9W847_TRYCI|nr:unnamed protein product [Trypanosoma congolense IL3000]
MSEKELRTHSSTEVLARHYGPVVGAKVKKYIDEFMPYADNFSSISCSLINDDKQLLLAISCPIHVAPPKEILEAIPREGRMYPVRVEIIFPSTFPNEPPIVRLLMGGFRIGKVVKWVVKQQLRGIATDGTINLRELPLLQQTESPYSLLEILVALTEEFEENFPLVPEDPADLTPPCRSAGVTTATALDSGLDVGPSAGTARFAAASTSVVSPPVAAPALTTAANVVREMTLQRACDAIFSHLQYKAEGYLDMRAAAAEHLFKLSTTSGQLSTALTALERRKEELLQHMPAPGKIEQLTSALEQVENSMEERSKCIVPADDLQAHALELLGEIHASDDVLELLERSLREGQIACEEYIRRVMDVGRQQFESRFLFDRVTEAVNYAQGGSISLPPSRTVCADAGRTTANVYTAAEPRNVSEVTTQLCSEFPQVGPEIIKAVLDMTMGNLQDARVQIQAMLS